MSIWLMVLTVKGMGFDLKKREFCDANKLRYDWLIDDIPSTCVCEEPFTVHSWKCTHKKRLFFPPLSHTIVDNVVQNTVQAFGHFLTNIGMGGGGGGGK